MASTGFLYFFNKLALNTGTYLVHYDFNQSGLTVPSVAQSRFSGLGTPPSAWNASGSGAFSNSVLNIANASNIAARSWTHLLLFDKRAVSDGVLFSSLSGSPISGHCIGTTASNKLFFYTDTVDGPQTIVSSLPLAQSNLVAVSRGANVVSFYKYDPLTNQPISESFFVKPYLESFASARLGQCSGFSSFSGYFDEYALFSQCLMPTVISSLFSGFLGNPVVSAPVIAYSGYTGVTGYQDSFTGVTGITGYSAIHQTSGVDEFGDPIYNDYLQAMTGYTYTGLLRIPLTGFISVPISGASSTAPVIDSALAVSAYGFDSVSLLRPIPSSDTIASFAATVRVSGQANERANYDEFLDAFKLNLPYSGNDVSLFVNGIYQPLGSVSITGNFYGSGYLLDGTYYLQKGVVLTDGSIVSEDSLSFDSLYSDRINLGLTSPVSGLAIPSQAGSGTALFLNGVFQTPNIDFAETPSGRYWSKNALVGELAAFSIPSGYGDVALSAFRSQRFVPRSSLLFVNGQRQILGEDYLESCAKSLLGASGLFDNTLTTVYNSDLDIL